jgi:hypothetical protein
MRLQGLRVHLLYLVLLFCCEIMGDKILQFWAHVFQQLTSWCIHILQLCNLSSSPLTFCPTTCFAYQRHCTIYAIWTFSIVQTLNVWIPHKVHSPMKHDMLCHSSSTGLEQQIEFHNLVKLENESWRAKHSPT